MPREIWNEGRVVGYSSYELYVKQHLGEHPEYPPATEREWLASSIAMGSSLLLKVPNVIQGPKDHTYVDILLPSNSRLAAANTIVAQFFDGDGYFPIDSNWATRVTDYGSLLSNTSTSSPDGVVPAEPDHPETELPAKTLEDWDATTKAKLREYLRICDGIVIQPGTWEDSENQPPQKDFQANLSASATSTPRIRLHVKGKIENNPLILLTGFTIKSVLVGVTGQDTATDTNAPEDGDFLGPAAFPWAAKIVFCVPNSYITYFDTSGYDRTILAPTSEGQSQTKEIKDTPVIDMQATRPETFYGASYATNYSYYSNNPAPPTYPYLVNDFSTLGDPPDEGEAVLTVYQKKDIYPPAMYGTFVGETGNHYLNPLDVVAPGTVKMFYNKTEQDLIDYETTFPGTTAMNKTSDGKIQILNVDKKIVDVAGIILKDMPVSSPRANTTVKVLQVTTGQKSGWALSMGANIGDGLDNSGDPIPPDALTISSNPTSNGVVELTNSNASDNISWAALLDALSNDYAIDLLGNRLKSAKYSLIRNHDTTSTGGPYLEFGPDTDKLRLYISDTAPNTTDVPEGSIGIGWGVSS